MDRTRSRPWMTGIDTTTAQRGPFLFGGTGRLGGAGCIRERGAWRRPIGIPRHVRLLPGLIGRTCGSSLVCPSVAAPSARTDSFEALCRQLDQARSSSPTNVRRGPSRQERRYDGHRASKHCEALTQRCDPAKMNAGALPANPSDEALIAGMALGDDRAAGRVCSSVSETSLRARSRDAR